MNVYAWPQGVRASAEYRVWVNGEESFVYALAGMEGGTSSFTSFDLNGRAQIRVRPTWRTETVEVRPISRAVVYRREGEDVVLTLERPGQYFVKFNGSFELPLYLFANGAERASEVPDARAETTRVFTAGEQWWERLFAPSLKTACAGKAHTYFFPPGVHHAGYIWLEDGETLYLAAGAVVHAVVQAHKARGIRIAGRGVLCLSDIPNGGGAYGPSEAIGLRQCWDVVIEDITIMDGFGWTIVPYDCERVTIRNVKIVNERLFSTDGINPVNCREVLIERCFIRCKDDNISIKGLVEISRQQLNWSAIENITVRGCVFWTNNNNAVVVGAETKAAYIRGVRVEDCDVLKATGISGDWSGALAVVLLDDTCCEDVAFDDIRVEYTTGHPFNVSFQERMFTVIGGTRRAEGGLIKNVSFTNIVFMDGLHRTSFISGAAGRRIEGVRFENIRIHGQRMRSAAEAKVELNEYARGVTWA
jgi:Glycosyl hydrolases family 28